MDGVLKLGWSFKSKMHLFMVDNRSYPHIVQNSKFRVCLEVDFGSGLDVRA